MESFQGTKIEKDRKGMSQLADLPPLEDTKIAVGAYLKLGFGICRQMAVIVGACMERAIREGKAPNWQGVEIRANYKGLGHVWTHLKGKNGREIVVDPARGYIGEVDNSGWDYQRGYENHIFGVPGT